MKQYVISFFLPLSADSANELYSVLNALMSLPMLYCEKNEELSENDAIEITIGDGWWCFKAPVKTTVNTLLNFAGWARVAGGSAGLKEALREIGAIVAFKKEDE